MALSVDNMKSFSVLTKNSVLILWINTLPRKDSRSKFTGSFYVEVFNPETCTHRDRASNKNLNTVRASTTLDSTLLDKARAKL